MKVVCHSKYTHIIVTSVYSHRVRRIIASALPAGIVNNLTFFYASFGGRWVVNSSE